jgi:hypothetical protein
MKFRLLLEKLLTYIYPTSTSEEMADFYMLELLYSSLDNNKDNFTEDDIAFIEDAVEDFLPKLKKNLLKDLAYAIQRELRHAEDAISKDDDFDINAMYEKPLYTIRDNIEKGSKEDIEIAKELYLGLDWETDYGGKPWADICDAWLKLNNSRNTKSLFLAIDAIYDLQHNTGTVFNKVQRYSDLHNKKDENGNSITKVSTSDYEDSFDWIKDFLDLKYESKNPWDLYSKLSSSLQSVSARLLYKLGFMTKQRYDEMIDNTKMLLGLIPTTTTVQEFNKFLDKGIFINYENDRILITILQKNDSIDVLDAAVKAGANIHSNKKSSLYSSIEKVEFFDYLIKAGVDFEKMKKIIFTAFDYRGKTLLPLLKYLIENKDKLEIFDEEFVELGYNLAVSYNFLGIELIDELVKQKLFKPESPYSEVDATPVIKKLIHFYSKSNKSDRLIAIGLIFSKYYPDFKEKYPSVFEQPNLELQKIITGTYKEKDGVINVEGSVNLNYKRISKIPYKFGLVTADFVCNNTQLTTLEGCPIDVGGNFSCFGNKLKTLEFGPKYVGGSYNCSSNELTSLKGCPDEIAYSFACDNNKLETLEGAPTNIGINFSCINNKLKDLKGAPKNVEGWFDCSKNTTLTSLEGAPKLIGNNFISLYNSYRFEVKDLPAETTLNGKIIN